MTKETYIPKTQSIKQIIDAYSFSIPEFQRGYSWQRQHWQDIWDDLLNAESLKHRNHFTGSIMISIPVTNEGDIQSSVSLIDGQQRMTTISILLGSLGGTPFSIEFINNEPLQTWFDFHVLGKTDEAPRLANTKSYYSRNLESAKVFFDEQVKQLPPEKRKTLISTVLDNFHIYVLSIPKGFDIHVAFETINNRGKPLSILEKLKNRLIFLASNETNENLRYQTVEHIHKCWKGIYSWLGKGKILLDDDKFLRVHALGWFKFERDANWLSTNLFHKAFPSNTRGDIHKITAYARSLELASACWYHINNPANEFPDSINKYFVSWARTGQTANTEPVLLWALMRLAVNNSNLISHLKESAMELKSFGELIQQAERFSVLIQLGNGRRTSYAQGEMYHIAFVLANPDEQLGWNDCDPVPLDSNQVVIQFFADCLKALIINKNPDDGTRLDERFRWDGYFDKDQLEKTISDRLQNNTGFYNWQLGKLFIYSWEEHLRGDRGIAERRSWEKFHWDDSVEHIFPQDPHKGWENMIRIDGRKQSLKNTIVQSLGNLMFLSTSRNSSVSNLPYTSFEENGQTYHGKQRRYSAGGSFSESQVASLCNEWTDVQIAARGIAIWRHAQKHWDFKVVSNDLELVNWLPFLFGVKSDDVRNGEVNGKSIDGRQLNPLVRKFECKNE